MCRYAYSTDEAGGVTPRHLGNRERVWDVSHTGAVASEPTVGLVGRDRQLEQLRSALTSRVCADPPFGSPVVVVLGEAGIGKTTLVRAVVSKAEGALVLTGAAVTIPGLPGLHTPFAVINEALGNAVPSVGPGLSTAIRTWIEPATDDGSLDPALARHRGLLKILGRISAHRPCVLVLEDLHWADPSSLAALLHLAHHVRDERLVVIVTGRPPEGTPNDPAAQAYPDVLDHLRRRDAIRLELTGLDDAAASALARSRGPVPERRAAAIVGLCEGNPLAIVEMAAATSHAGSLPPGVAAVVGSAWRRTSGEGRAVLAAASTIGLRVPHTLLFQVIRSGLDRPSTGNRALTDAAGAYERGVRDAVDVGLLFHDGDTYSFRHALHRQAIYDAVLPAERAGWHRGTALALQALASAHGDRSAGTLAQVAAHWAATDDHAPTAAACADAGLVSFVSGSLAESLSLLEQALTSWALLGGDPPGWEGRWSQVAERYGACARSQGQGRRALDRLEGAHSSGTADERAGLLGLLGWLRFEVGDQDGAREAVDAAVALADSDMGRAKALLQRSWILWWTGATVDRDRDVTAALTLTGDLPSATRAGLLEMAGACCDDYERGVRLIEEGKECARRAGAQPEFWASYTQAINVPFRTGHWAAAERACRELIEEARREGLIGSPALLTPLGQATGILVALGAWDTALDALDEAVSLGVPPSRFGGWLLGNKAEIHVYRGERVELDTCLTEMRRLGRHEATLEANASLHEADMLTWRGDYDGARSAVSRCVSLMPPTHDISFLDDLLEVTLRLDADQANDPARPHVQVLSESLLARRSAEDWMTVGLEETIIAETARRNGTDTPEQWAAIVAIRDGMPRSRSYALLREGEAFLRQGARAPATRALREAAAIAKALRANTLLDPIRAAAARARISVEGDRPTRPSIPAGAAAAGLTERETHVLSQLLLGRTDRQIARHLTISERTVQVHVSHLLAKLGASSRMQAAATAHRLHLLDNADSDQPTPTPSGRASPR